MAKQQENPQAKTLEAIAKVIEPEAVAKKIDIPHDKAREAYTAPATVSNHNDFRKQVISYVQHHHKAVHGTDLSEEMAFGQAQNILDQLDEREGGWKFNYQNAKSGENGGLAGVLNKLKDTFKNQHRQNYISNAIDSKIDPTDFKAHKDLASAYVKKFGGLLGDRKPKDPAQLVADKSYKGIVKEHAALVSQARKSIAYE